MSLTNPARRRQFGARLAAALFVALSLLACRDGGSGDGSSSATAPVSASARAASRPPASASPLRPLPAHSSAPGVAHVAETVDDEPVDEHDEACAPADAGVDPMLLLRFVWTSGIEGKDPKDKLQIGRPGQRIYAYFTMRNRSGRNRCMHVSFEVGGKVRSAVTLKVGKSWSWRTWAYNTMRSDDRTPLRLVVKDDQGQLVLDKTLPIVPE